MKLREKQRERGRDREKDMSGCWFVYISDRFRRRAVKE